jgi:drug/metabolite transporter superfamily protein YnfA
MTDLISPPPEEKLLPRPPRPVLFFLVLALMDITGGYSAIVTAIMGRPLTATLLGTGLVAITIVAIINHRHNHAHRWLLAVATAITLLLAVLWTVALINR